MNTDGYCFTFTIAAVKRLADGCQAVRLDYQRRNRVAAFVVRSIERDIRPGETLTCKFRKPHVTIQSGMIAYRVGYLGEWFSCDDTPCTHRLLEFAEIAPPALKEQAPA